MPPKTAEDLPAQPGAEMQRQRREQPAQRRAKDHQPPHALCGIGQLVQVQRQAALEQDHRNGDRDRRPDQRAQIALGDEKAKARPDDQPQPQASAQWPAGSAARPAIAPRCPARRPVQSPRPAPARPLLQPCARPLRPLSGRIARPLLIQQERNAELAEMLLQGKAVGHPGHIIRHDPRQPGLVLRRRDIGLPFLGQQRRDRARYSGNSSSITCVTCARTSITEGARYIR